MFVARETLAARVGKALKQSPVTAMLGPRQCGKTTLAKHVGASVGAQYFDLEKPSDLAALQNPMLALEPLKGVVILDEIQRCPEALPILRVLSDRRPLPCRFILLGSASPDIVRGASESLAGRVRFIDMSGFAIEEVGNHMQDRLWLRGGLPAAFLARSEAASNAWRQDYVRTFLERDLPQLGIQVPAATMRRFWTMMAHYHGQVWNGSEIGGALGLSHTTVRRYLDILTGAYMIRQLQPWFVNAGKRVVKSPRVYVRDSGLLHFLLNIEGRRELLSHPKLGASWEGFAIEQILCGADERNAYFWSTHAGAELDLLLVRGARRWGFEFKVQDAPVMTKSMHVAMSDLQLHKLWVVHPAPARYRLHEKAEAIGLADALDLLR